MFLTHHCLGCLAKDKTIEILLGELNNRDRRIDEANALCRIIRSEEKRMCDVLLNASGNKCVGQGLSPNERPQEPPQHMTEAERLSVFRDRGNPTERNGEV